MTATSVHYQLNRPSIIDELIEGEIVAVDLQRGTYYSIRGTGVEIWHRLAAPSTRDAVVEQMAELYCADRDEVAAATGAFIDQLVAVGLLRQADETGGPTPPPATPAAADLPAAFSPPVLEAFTDMEDLLLLDPIDDVTGRGWPHAQDQAHPAP